MENNNSLKNLVKYQKCSIQYTGAPLSRVTSTIKKKASNKKSNITYDKAHAPSPTSVGER